MELSVPGPADNSLTQNLDKLKVIGIVSNVVSTVNTASARAIPDLRINLAHLSVDIYTRRSHISTFLRYYPTSIILRFTLALGRIYVCIRIYIYIYIRDDPLIILTLYKYLCAPAVLHGKYPPDVYERSGVYRYLETLDLSSSCAKRE